jgi:hypothetical protein
MVAPVVDIGTTLLSAMVPYVLSVADGGFMEWAMGIF